MNKGKESRGDEALGTAFCLVRGGMIQEGSGASQVREVDWLWLIRGFRLYLLMLWGARKGFKLACNRI